MAQVLWVSLRERRAIGYFFLFCFVFFFFFFFDIYNMEATCCWLLLALVPTVSKHLVIKSGKRGEGVGNRSVEIQVIGSLSPAGRLQITIVEKKREKKILKRVNVMMKMMAEKSFKRNAFDGSEFGETLTARKGKLLMSRSTFWIIKYFSWKKEEDEELFFCFKIL